MQNREYETDCTCHGKKTIRGINCDAKKCAYNDGECRCTAENVCVGPCDAGCSSDTVCATFKPKTY